MSLTIDNVLRALAERANHMLDHQIADPSHPQTGALLSAAWGMPDPGGTVMIAASCGFLHLAGTPRDGGGTEGDASWLDRATLAIDFVLRAQHPSGLLDLLSCNYDSSPDAGFAVQRLSPLIELGRPLAQRDAGWAAFLGKVELFIRRAVPGMLTGGFHTPNHRWVIASALAQAKALFPDLEVAQVVEAYLAEGFDVDDEGAYIERSIAVYDAACDRSLLLLAEHWDCPPAIPAVRANLEFDLHLLHADGTAETGLSRRQDYGTKTVPISLAAPYLRCAHLTANPLFAAAARTLWKKAPAAGTDDLNWLYVVMAKHGEPDVVDGGAPPALPDDFVRHFPLNGIWRVRRGPLSATLFGGSSRLMTLRYGQAELSSLKISQSYFGVGQFFGDTLTANGSSANGSSANDSSATLHSYGQSRPHRPGYDLPLGRPVDPQQWKEIGLERPFRALAACSSTLTVRPVEQGLEVCYRTLEGAEGVTAQLALDFPPGGIWETDDVCLSPQAGQVIFFKQGYGAMRYGNDVIRIGPGTHAHRMWQMRDAEVAPDHVRVLLTFTTPVQHTFTLEVYHAVVGQDPER